jgi:hypothetical protein
VRRLQILAVVMGSAGLLGCLHEDGGGGGPFRDVVSMAPAGVELADWQLRCRQDLDCGAGFRCIIPAGASIRNGVCGTVVDHEGVRLSKRTRAVPGCVFRQDCPLAFSCLKVSSLDGLCVK